MPQLEPCRALSLQLNFVASPCPALSLLARRTCHNLHPPACAGVALNTQQVHPEQAELLLVAAGSAAAGFPAAGAAQRSAAGWCSHAGGSRATKTSPQVMILGSPSIYIQQRVSPSKDRPDLLRVRVRKVVSGVCGCVSRASRGWHRVGGYRESVVGQW